MATLSTKDFVTLVREQSTAIQGTAKILADLTVGSILRAVVEANAAVVLWLQGLILQLLAITRASTSSGSDLDSWIADFGGITRLAAVSASGLLTFARFTATQQAIVTVGTTVQSSDGSHQYAVTLDTTNGNYNATLGGYVLAAGVSSISVPITATVGGSAANAVIGGINTLTQAVPGVDTVTNAAAFTNGVDAESDAALRVRFIAYIAGLSKATKTAIGYALTSLQQGVSYLLVENQLYNGTTQMGYFYAVVDDGTGAPGSTFLATASNAIDAVRPFTSTFGVYAPVIVNASASMLITTASGYVHATVVGQVGTAIANYINSLALGQSLSYSRLAQVAYDASPGVTNVTSVTLNGGTADLTATVQQIIKSSVITVA
ncbi:MAG: baseplate J/gp47 family protein [Methylobacter sp.]